MYMTCIMNAFCAHIKVHKNVRYTYIHLFSNAIPFTAFLITVTLQKEEFVSQHSSLTSVMPFLQWFTETQMFKAFITERETTMSRIGMFVE